MAIGVPAAFVLVRQRLPGKTALLALLLLPLIVPNIIIAVSLFYLYARLGLVGTSTGLVIGHTVLAVPFVVTWLAVDWEVFQPMLGTVGLNGSQWGLVLLLALVTPVVIELEKWTRRLRVAGTSSPARHP